MQNNAELQLQLERRPPDDSADRDIWVGAGDSLQDTIDDHGAGTRILLGDGYDISVETLPITVDVTGVEIKGTSGGGGAKDSIVTNPTGKTFLLLDPQNPQPPGITLRDLTIMQAGEGNAIRTRHSRFNRFENVHAVAENPGQHDLWYFGAGSSDWVNDSQLFLGCSAYFAGRDGFRFGSGSHNTSMYGCIARGSTRMGVHTHGPSAFTFHGGRVAENGAAGVRSRNTDTVSVRHAYVGENCRLVENDSVDVQFENSPNASVEHCWMSGGPQDGTVHAVGFYSSHSGTVRNIQTDSNYQTLAYTDSADTELYRSSHQLPDGVSVVAVTDAARRVRDHGTIIGAGQEHGGGNDTRGVNLAQVEGQLPLDSAVSDGSHTRAGHTARWLTDPDAWVPSDGSPRVSYLPDE